MSVPASSAQYEPLPTLDNDGEQPPGRRGDKAPETSQAHLRPFYIVLLIAACFAALALFKASRNVDVTQYIPGTPSNRASTTEEKSRYIGSTSVAVAPTDSPSRAGNGTDSKHGMHSKLSVGYFVNWGIYGRKFPPSLIPANDLTHILYAFANLRPDSGEVFLSDVWADKDIHYPGDTWDESGNNLYGNLKAIYKLKKQNRHLKVLLSIGGWTYSPSFHPIVVSPEHRAKFVYSSLKLLEDYGLDGLDIDYEYPQNDEQAKGYVLLLKELRAALDQHSREKGTDYRFLLTIAAPCGPQHYKKLHVAEMNRFLDFWNMMAYDFAGSWDPISGHQANLHGGPISAAEAIHWYIHKGVPRHKIVMGLPLYGRSFMNTEGPGTPYSGTGEGSWEAGVYDYRVLPLPNSHIHTDDKAVASWTYDYQKKQMISFDSEEIGKRKGEWIRKEGLAGSMFWELSGDKGSEREGMEGGEGKTPQPGQSLVHVVKEAMGPLDSSHNWLRYDGSQFDNMRKGM